LIGLDDIELEITDGAVSAVAKRAIELKTGARGLRTILENLMLDTMYDLPSSEDVAKVIVDESVVVDGAKPKIVRKEIA
jgi:ATP-dependent Clp protease ATP-binding subunit ClpX